MLPTIHFDHQSITNAAEVHDVIADRMLTAKLRTHQPLRPEILPEQAFGWSLFATQTTAVSAQLFGCSHNSELYDRVG